jgi:hypothetical protein
MLGNKNLPILKSLKIMKIDLDKVQEHLWIIEQLTIEAIKKKPEHIK